MERMHKVEKIDLKEIVRQHRVLLIIGGLCLALVIAARIVFAIFHDDPRTKNSPASIEDLPKDAQIIIKELEKDEYIGMSQAELDEALRRKGIYVPKR